MVVDGNKPKRLSTVNYSPKQFIIIIIMKEVFFFLKTSKFSNFEPSHIVSLHIFSDRTRWPVGCLDLNLS